MTEHQTDSQLAPSGRLGVRKITAPRSRPAVRTVEEARLLGSPPRRHPVVHAAARVLAPEEARRWEFQDANAEHFQRSLDAMEQHERGGKMSLLGQLFAEVVHLDGTKTDLGLVSCRVITDSGVNFIVDAFQGLVEPELMRYHGVGTGTTAEAATQTALVTELTTQYATASTRPTGSLGEQAGVPNVYETIATITVSAAVAVTEHGIFSQPAVPGGVMLDRSVFAAVNLASSEAMQVTYRLTVPSGG